MRRFNAEFPDTNLSWGEIFGLPNRLLLDLAIVTVVIPGSSKGLCGYRRHAVS